MRRFVPGLALLSTLTGCVSAPPKGAFVEYHAGLTPTTRPVKCEATYALYLKDQVRPSEPLLTQCARKGEHIGFASGDDGTVIAIAPGSSLTLPPGSYVWEAVPGTAVPWRKRVHLDLREAVLATLVVVGVAALVVGVAFLAASNKDKDPNDPNNDYDPYSDPSSPHYNPNYNSNYDPYNFNRNTTGY